MMYLVYGATLIFMCYLYWRYAASAAPAAMKLNQFVLEMALLSGDEQQKKLALVFTRLPHLGFAIWLTGTRYWLGAKLYILRTTESQRMRTKFSHAFDTEPDAQNAGSRQLVKLNLMLKAFDIDFYRHNAICASERDYCNFKSKIALIEFDEAVKSAHYFGYDVSVYWGDYYKMFAQPI